MSEIETEKFGIADALRAPFAPEAVKWRIGSTSKDKTRGLALAYIDARDVMERLDEVVGPFGWQSKMIRASNGGVTCELSILVPNPHKTSSETMVWITRTDGAGETAVEGPKGACSDAFKRAAVHFGIGRYLYDLQSPWVALKGRQIDPAEKPTLEALLRRAAVEPVYREEQEHPVEAVAPVPPQPRPLPAPPPPEPPPAAVDFEKRKQDFAADFAGHDDETTLPGDDLIKSEQYYKRCFALAEQQYPGDQSKKFSAANEVQRRANIGRKKIKELNLAEARRVIDALKGLELEMAQIKVAKETDEPNQHQTDESGYDWMEAEAEAQASAWD